MRATIGSFAAAAAVIGTATASANAQQAVQWRVEDGGNGHWYALRVPTGESLSWDDARDAATASGGYLASITSEGENDFALTSAQSLNGWWVLNSSPPYCVGPWLGGFQPPGSPEPAGGWRWVTDEPWGWTNWWAPANEPNNGCGGGEDYLHWLSQGSPNPSGSWNDVAFTDTCGIPSPKSYLIEWSADCNGDGIVDYGQCRDGSLPDYNGNNIPDCCEAGTPCEVGNYPVQWRVEDGGNGHWYVTDVTLRSWDHAKLHAIGAGGHLATITTDAENEFVRTHAYVVGPFTDTWLGAWKESAGSDWQWITGEPWAVLPTQPTSFDGIGWDSSYPLYLEQEIRNFQIGAWADESNSANIGNRSLIEWSADCNGDGIVDYGQILSGQLADSNQDGVPNICQCPGDITRNGSVNGLDLAAVLSAWGTDGQGEFIADIDNDGIVSGTDLAFVLGGWGPCQ